MVVVRGGLNEGLKLCVRDLTPRAGRDVARSSLPFGEALARVVHAALDEDVGADRSVLRNDGTRHDRVDANGAVALKSKAHLEIDGHHAGARPLLDLGEQGHQPVVGARVVGDGVGVQQVCSRAADGRRHYPRRCDAFG